MDVISKEREENVGIDSASAFQAYLNTIPISSFPNIGSTPVVEVQAGDLLRDAIHKLYQKNASVALIVDSSADHSNTSIVTTTKLSDRYIGVISFASMTLWCIEQLHKGDHNHSKIDAKGSSKGFFSRLDQDSQFKQTKVSELAKFFLWDPFFPVHLEEDTLFHVLLLLSKHRLRVVPVIERSKSRVIGFITQTAVVKLLLKSDGVEWFDSVANDVLSEFHFERKDSACQLYADQSVSEAISILSEKQVGAVAVVDRSTGELTGTVRESDISQLLENDALFTGIRTTTLAEFVAMKNNENENNPVDDSVEPLLVQNNSTPTMDAPVMHRQTDILKQVMVKMAEANSESSFLIDKSCNVVGMLTVRDIIMEFAPPCVDSRIDGGGFFESALQQTGCHIDNGTMVIDQ